VDLKQEGGSAVHAAADLEGDEGTLSNYAVDDELVVAVNRWVGRFALHRLS
jgi:hypothetical protein